MDVTHIILDRSWLYDLDVMHFTNFNIKPKTLMSRESSAPNELKKKLNPCDFEKA